MQALSNPTTTDTIRRDIIAHGFVDARAWSEALAYLAEVGERELEHLAAEAEQARADRALFERCRAPAAA